MLCSTCRVIQHIAQVVVAVFLLAQCQFALTVKLIVVVTLYSSPTTQSCAVSLAFSDKLIIAK